MAVTHNQEFMLFYHKLGEAIASWANVESALFNVFLRGFKKGNYDALYSAYFSIESFRSKLNAVDRVFRGSIDDKKTLATWTDIKDTLNTLSTARNRLAHWRVSSIDNDRTGRRVALVNPHDLNLKNWRLKEVPAGAQCLRDIARTYEDFEHAYYRIIDLLNHLDKRSSASMAEMMELPLATVEQMAKQMRETINAKEDPY